MSLPDRRRLILALALLPLAGCGFTPVYAPQGPGAALKGRLRLDPPQDRRGYDFRNRMEERLGAPADPRWAMSYRIETDQSGVGITPDGVTTRYNITGRVHFTISDLATGAEVYAGTAQGFTSFSAEGTTVAMLAAERDAYERLMHILADQAAGQLIAGYGGWPG